MCTVTFIPRDGGFLLGMNRDERWERGRRSLPPSIGDEAIFPRDEAGGTWIGVNSSAIAFAILNRNGPAPAKRRSRGEIIPQLLPSGSIEDAQNQVRTLDLAGTLPFTLLIASDADKAICEHIWDGISVSTIAYPWTRQHWFSSGLSDHEAILVRSDLVRASQEPDHLSAVDWMRELHRKHGTAPGPFSICVHREDVGSVSYTEVHADSAQVEMSYWAGSPCQNDSAQPVSLVLTRSKPKPRR